MEEPIVSKLLKIALYAVLALGIMGIVTLPWLLPEYTWYFYGIRDLTPEYRIFIMLFLLVTAVLGLWIIVEMIRMLDSIPQGPFIRANVRALSRLGSILFVLATIFFAKCFIYVTLLTLGGGCLFTIAGLFALTLANLIRQAVIFKEENDLTI